MGRHPKHEPALAYEYRRYMTLIQVLALEQTQAGNLTGLQTLAASWGLPAGGNYQELVSRLSNHVVIYTRNEREQA